MPGLLEEIVEHKVFNILKTLAKSPKKLFHLNSLASNSKVPVTSTARIIKRLVKISLAEEVKVGKLSLYKLSENKKTKQLRDIL